MARFTGPVLADTNGHQAHRVLAWKALASGYAVETVESVTMETHTGVQRRDPAQAIDQAALCASLRAIYPVHPGAGSRAQADADGAGHRPRCG